MPNPMKVSIVICSYGIERLNDVVEIVGSLQKQNYNNYEIILVIDKEKKYYDKLEKSLPKMVKIIESTEKGLSNARNIGVRIATGDIIAFIDDDAIADRNWLSTLIKNYEDKDVIGVGGKIEPIWEGNKPKWFSEALNWIVGCTYIGHPKYKCEVRNLIGCNMSFKREVFEKSGLYKSEIGRVGKKLYSGEEMEFCMRALNKIPNARIIYEPDAKVYHKVPKERQSLIYTFKRAYNEGISKALITKTAFKSTNVVLSTESRYIKSMIQGEFLKESEKVNNVLIYAIQFGILWLIIFTVGISYYIRLYFSG